jgi:type I restriction enzyme S subunit
MSLAEVKIEEAFIVKDGTHDSPKYIDKGSGYPLITSKNLRTGKIDFTDVDYISKEDYDKINLRSKVDKGDLLFAMIGTIGNPVIVETEPKFAIKNVALFKKNSVGNSIDYLRFTLSSEQIKRRLINDSKGGTQQFVSLGYLRKLKIPLPGIEDQIRIANILSKAETLISQRKESLRLLDELLKSTFLEMFGDPVRNEKGWEKLTLKEFGKIITGNTPPRNDDDNYSSNFIEWIKTDNIESDKLFVTKATEYLSESGAAKARFVDKGALLIACIAGSIESVGRAALTNRRVSFNQQINAIQPSEDISSYFLLWLFKISKLYIQNHATKGMKKILTKGDFEKIIMINPPLKLQTQFAHIVEKTEALKAYYQTSLQELENLYGSLSQKAFSSAGASAQAGKGELGLKGGGASYAEALEWFSPTKQFITKLESFKSLEPNWDSYGAQPPSSKTVETAINFVKKADKNELPLYFVAPGPNGELVIEFRKGKKEASAFINPDGSTELILNEGNNYVLEGTLEDNYKDLLNFINA